MTRGLHFAQKLWGVRRPRKPANDNHAALMRRIDELFSAWHFLGSRRMTRCCAPMACS